MFSISDERVRSAIRFAVALAAADVILLVTLGSSTAAVLGSFAIAVHLYFLDFDGSARERVVGNVTATLVGAAAVVIGTLLTGSLAGALLGAFIVAGGFAFARTMRGYVARSVVGLSGAFFLPVMSQVPISGAGQLLLGWCIGSAVSLVCILCVLPHRRSGVVRRALAQWLTQASMVTRRLGHGESATTEIDQLRTTLTAIHGSLGPSFSLPGAVGVRQRALAEMVSHAKWSAPLVDLMSPVSSGDQGIVDASSEGFLAAASFVIGRKPTSVPDLPADRAADLQSLAGQPTDEVTRHYTARLLSIIAMNQLWLAARSVGKVAPRPDLGMVDADGPLEIIRATTSATSVWVRYAVLTGIGAAACVLLVWQLGLSHGLWVILAALAIFQGAFSASSGWREMLAISAGTGGGVLAAGVLFMLHLPYGVFVVLLIPAVFAAKFAQTRGLALAQLCYTPLALINFSVLMWPPGATLVSIRFTDVLLGAAIATALTVLMFPTGIRGVLSRLQSAASFESETYLADQVAAATGASNAKAQSDRTLCTRAIVAFEQALHAGYLTASRADLELQAYERTVTLARDRLIGGDACGQLASRRNEPGMAEVAQAEANWWRSLLAVELPLR